MKRILFIALIGAFAMTTSCAHKKASTPSDVEVVDATIDKKQQPKEVAKNIADKMNSSLAYTCIVAGDKRIVTLDKGKSKCTVNYTKEGNTNEVAWGENHPDICQTAFDKIRTNIEGAGFKCNTGLETAQKPVKTALVQ